MKIQVTQLNYEQLDHTVKLEKWNRDLAEHISKTQWLEEINRIYVTTNIPKLRSFQYRLLQRALVTNVNLYRWGITTNNLCVLCNSEIETINHLFVECSCVSLLWQQIESFILDSFGITITLMPRNKLWGCTTPKKQHTVNFILLVTRQYIYRQRCLKKKISFVALKNEILTLKKVEKYIALKNHKEKQYLRKWGEPCNN